MMVSEAPQIISYMQFREKRSAWQQRLRQERQSWIARHPIVKSWRLLGKEAATHRGVAILCECVCGAQQFVNLYDIKRGKSRCCRSCAGKKRVRRDKRTNLAVFLARCKKGAEARAKVAVSKYTSDELIISHIMRGAKKRCNNKAHKNYGERGIRFLFPDVETSVRWVIVNIGSRPSPQFSIDRIDNSGHYEAGNLRWATRSEQLRNRRTKPMSQRQIRLFRLLAARPDYTLGGISSLIQRGLTDIEIVQLEKSKGGRPRKRA